MSKSADDKQARFTEAAKTCQDSDGNPVTLDELCHKEPAWAASRLRHERAQALVLREWAAAKIVGRGHPYHGPSAPETDVIWAAVVMMIDKTLTMPKDR